MNIRLFLSGLVVAASALSAAAVDYTPAYTLIDNENYDCEDLGVASFNVLDYGVDNTGATDCTRTVQYLLNVAGGNSYNTTGNHDNLNSSGGVVYFPAGTYSFSGQIIIPRGVTIRGDWRKPVAGLPVEGTIFRITDSGKEFIVMQPSTLVTNLAFWYPDQRPGNITPMPATVMYGQDGYWGNEYCNVRHCTFINSYTAIRFNPRNGGGCPNIYDIYGTPLSIGFEMDCIADVGRFDSIHFSASYWEGSGLPGSPSVGQIDDWLYNNAVGIIMRRNDWSYTCNVDIEGYNVGFHAEKSPVDGSNPNGHNYGFNLRNCHTGVKLSGVSGAGIMFTDVNTTGCRNGICLVAGTDGPALFYGCNIDGKGAAINMFESASTSVMLQDCNVNGTVYASGGHFQAVNNTFSKNVNVGPTARTIFTDNTFTSGASLDNKSIFKCAVADNTGYTYPTLPRYERSWMEARVTTPARKALYVVTDAPSYNDGDRNNRIDPTIRQDCSRQIQAMLDKAGAEGGGIVYLPAGHYLCNAVLSIPKGVELKGASDIPTVPKGNGAILEVNVGEGSENGIPFISMAEESGLRGVTINYPRQINPANVRKYPYSVRGNRDCYIVNLAIRAAYRGVDLFTNKCDRHYVDYLAGHAFMNVARIGGDAEDGVFSNAQCNTIVYACGSESKFGTWHNSLGISGTVGQQCYCQNERDLDFLIVGDCKREFLYNNFLFGCNKGMHFISDRNGGAYQCRSLGNAVDGAVETFVIDGIASDLDLVNSQIVALNHNPYAGHNLQISDYLSACFISTGSGVAGKTVNFFSTNNWGGGDYMTDIKAGTVNIAMTNMDASGDLFTFYPHDSGRVNVFNGRFNNMKQTLATADAASRTSVVSSEIEYKGDGARPSSMTWQNNLPPVRELGSSSALASRTGWKATASKNNTNASKAIDGINSTRWDTASGQRSGDWFNVDFNTTLNINTVILDTSLSSGDAPAGYRIEAMVSGTWRQVASGNSAGAFCIVTFDPITASQIRVIQTGSKSNYWSIHEFYVGRLDLTSIDEIAVDRGDFDLTYDGSSIIAGAEKATVSVYTAGGALALSSPAADGTLDVTSLTPGVYIAVAHTSSGIAVLKFIR